MMTPTVLARRKVQKLTWQRERNRISKQLGVTVTPVQLTAVATSFSSFPQWLAVFQRNEFG